MGKLQAAAGVICLGLLVFIAGLATYTIVKAPEHAEFGKNVLLLIVGAVVGVVTGFFAEARDKIVYETPANFRTKITIESEDK